MKIAVRKGGVIEQVTPVLEYIAARISFLSWDMEGLQVTGYYPDEGEVGLQFTSKGLARFTRAQMQALLDLTLETEDAPGKVLLFQTLESEEFKERTGPVNVHKMWFSAA